jgi:quercetin dioxygenase-like cupin family protein
MSKEEYPDCIKNLPKVKIALQGVQGWLAQGKDFQVVFFEIEPIGAIPQHSHKAQYGIVLEGKMNLTIGEKTKLYEKGDTYFIPEGIVHQAEFLTHFRAMDFFFEPDRYDVE